ncbi:MAG: Wzz/FepE/Etk N-terminal domain-containing protein [Planctomycetota bacterium]|jgi:LPS O-antigen subunit length determinant protein (WzzB/FepE family)
MTQNANHSEPKKSRTDNPEDEIELIDLLRVIWRWKYLIIGGTFVFAIAAVIISLNMTKIYSVDTIIEPGILSIINEGGDQDRRVYIDTPQNIKALIDVGSFEDQISTYLDKQSKNTESPKHIHFKTSIPKQSNALKITYETSKGEQGKKILNLLNNLLIKKYSQLIQYYQKDFDSKIQLKASKLSELTNQISKVKNEIATVEIDYDNKILANNSNEAKLANQILNVQNDISTIEVDYGRRIKLNKTKIKKISYKILKEKNSISNLQSDTDAAIKQKSNKISSIKARQEAKRSQIKNLQNGIHDIQAEIGRVTKNTDFLVEERNRLLASETNGNNILSSVMYINTIQQNIGYLNDLKNRINNINHQIFQEMADVENLENQIRDLVVQKENLVKQTEFKVDNMKSQIDDLENDIKDLDIQNDSLEKEKSFIIANRKFQINNLESDVNKLKVETENYIKQRKYEIAILQSQIKDLESQTKYTSEEIQTLEYKKDNVQNIQILKSPMSSSGPIKPNMRRNVILATMFGLFMMVFLSFFFEYITKNRKKRS